MSKVPSTPFVVIVILNWNGWQDTLGCVESCRRLTWPNFRILVVDNASSDGSEEILRSRLPDVEILQSGQNLGFAGGNNVGIRKAVSRKADYIWLLNNDAEADPEALTALVNAMEAAPRAAIAGSKIRLFDDPRLLGGIAGIWEKGRLRRRVRGANELDRGQYDHPAEMGSVSGCSMLVRTSAIPEIGLMDESYFLFWEDTDWCARAWKNGYTVLYEPKSSVRHKVSASTGKNAFAQHYYFFRNGLHFLARYDRMLVPRFVFTNFIFCVWCLIRGNPQRMRGLWVGAKAFWAGKVGPLSD